MTNTLNNISLQNRKVAIVGMGTVGASIAYALTIRNIAREIVLVSRYKDKAAGEAMDIQHGIPYMGASSVYAGDYGDCADCDLIIITVGRNRKVGENRLDLASENLDMLKNTIEKVKPYYTRGAILIVGNPVDIMTYKATEWMGLPDGRVFGTGNILDTSRLVRVIADYVGLSTEVVKCSVVGEHGDGQIPIWSKLSIAGVSMDDYAKSMGIQWDDQIKAEIEGKVRAEGATIIEAKGKTHYGIATCVCYIADAVLNQRPTIASVTSVLQNEYGLHDVALSVPSIVGVNGIECRLEEKWSEIENEAFLKTAEKMLNFMDGIDGRKRELISAYVF